MLSTERQIIVFSFSVHAEHWFSRAVVPGLGFRTLPGGHKLHLRGCKVVIRIKKREKRIFLLDKIILLLCL